MKLAVSLVRVVAVASLATPVAVSPALAGSSGPPKLSWAAPMVAPQNQTNRLEASFTESAASITNRIADLGTFQLINRGTGTVERFGAATVVVGITQDRSVNPCGQGSWTNAATRRIVLDEGVLVLFESSIACPTATGPVITGTYTVDGRSSTGIFAGARGSGELTVNVPTSTSTLSGKLKLAGSDGD